tara:strand:- start:286 stop:684 length:399 start_codon:yes stop_codon:yes gene_type:complete
MDKEKRMSVIQFLLEGATEILGEKTLKERFTEMENPEIDMEKIKINHITRALRDSPEFVTDLQRRLIELKNVAETLRMPQAKIIEKWLEDDCLPCLVEKVIDGYSNIYYILIAIDEKIMWTGWSVFGKFNNP